MRDSRTSILNFKVKRFKFYIFLYCFEMAELRNIFTYVYTLKTVASSNFSQTVNVHDLQIQRQIYKTCIVLLLLQNR